MSAPLRDVMRQETRAITVPMGEARDPLDGASCEYEAAFRLLMAQRGPNGRMGPSPNRLALVGRYAWAVPSEAALSAIVRHARARCGGRVVEIGAGTGYWAMLLRARGLDVLAVDHRPGADNFFVSCRRYVPVERGGPETAGAHPDRLLFLCWPPDGDPMAFDAILAHWQMGGAAVAYIGQQGVTGDDRFHAALAEYYDCVDSERIPQWPSMRDRLTVWVRKAGAR